MRVHLYLPGMKLSVKRIGQLAVPAATVALLFQLYWLRQTWLTARQTFRTAATECLQKAYDVAMMSNLGQMEPANDTVKRLSISSSINLEELEDDENETEEQAATRDSMINTLATRLHMDTGKSRTIPVPNVDYAQMSNILSRMFSSFGFQLVNMDTLQHEYKLLLQEKNIGIPFKLYTDPILSDVRKNPRALLIHPALNNQTNTIGVLFTGETVYLLKQISPAIVVSFFIGLLIIGCIWILWRTIIKQQKLEQMKQDFISHVTHELKTPVAVLQATNEALLNFGGSSNPEMTTRYLQLSKKELGKLQELIDEIMTITRQEQQPGIRPATAIPLEHSLQEIIKRFAYQENVNICIDNQSAHHSIETDKQAFETIFSNLLDNAIKYNNKPEKLIILTIKDNRERVLITVTDNGEGIANSHLPFIFDKFYRVTNGDTQDTKGHGLGLSHVKALTQQLHATVEVSSTPGTGTMFTLQFPRYAKN